MALHAGALGAFSVRLATLNHVKAGRTAGGDISDLDISGSANINVTAPSTYFTGDVKTKTGTLSSTIDAANFTVATAAGNLILSPYSKISASKEFTTTDGKISSTDTALTLESGTGDVTVKAASNIVTNPGSWVSSRSSGGANFTTSGTANLISSGTGNVALEPASGGKLTTNAEFKTSHGTISSSVGALVSTDADDLTLSPFRNLICTVPFKTTNGSISSTSPGGLTISSTDGNVALNAAGNLTTESKFVTTDGRIESTVAASFTTTTGNLTLSPAGEVVIDKNATFTTGNLTSPGEFKITPGAGESVRIDGDLIVKGSITTVEATSLEVSDKTITLAHADVPADSTADGAGMIIEGSAAALDPAAKDLSLLWNENAGGTPYWRMSGGDFYITRKIGTNIVTYQFMIDGPTTDLVLKKQVTDVANPALPVVAGAVGVAEFGV